MKKYKYRITGKVHDQDSEDEDDPVEIDEIVEIDEKDTAKAYEKFFEDYCYGFYGDLKMVDADTYGKIWAIYKNYDASLKLIIELINEEK